AAGRPPAVPLPGGVGAGPAGDRVQLRADAIFAVGDVAAAGGVAGAGAGGVFRLRAPAQSARPRAGRGPRLGERIRHDPVGASSCSPAKRRRPTLPRSAGNAGSIWGRTKPCTTEFLTFDAS